MSVTTRRLAAQATSRAGRGLVATALAFVMAVAVPVAVAAAPPSATLAIGDVSVVEGHSGTSDAVFRVTVTNPRNKPVAVDFATTDGSATAPADYVASNGRLTFPADARSGDFVVVRVPIVGDTTDEPDETFTVRLANATNATIADGLAAGTIVDDDSPPPPPPPAPSTTLRVEDASVVEGTGGTRELAFRVSITGSAGQTVGFDFATVDGSASAPDDYTATSGRRSLSGVSDGYTVVRVPVVGDALTEDDEWLQLAISNPSGATIADADGTGTILDDDLPQPTLVDYDWEETCEPVSSPYTHGCDARATSDGAIATRAAINSRAVLQPDRPVPFAVRSRGALIARYNHEIPTASQSVTYTIDYAAGDSLAAVRLAGGSGIVYTAVVATARHLSCASCVVTIERVIVGSKAARTAMDERVAGHAARLAVTMVNTSGGVVPAGNVDVDTTFVSTGQTILDPLTGTWQGELVTEATVYAVDVRATRSATA